MRIFTVAFTFVLLAACSKPSSTPPETSSQPVEEDKPDADSGTEERPKLTAAECEAQGGQVIGDIGDGAIHRPDYRCADSGEAPIGTIVPDEGGPVAIEGSVCCK
jgi:hypothetical protein